MFFVTKHPEHVVDLVGQIAADDGIEGELVVLDGFLPGLLVAGSDGGADGDDVGLVYAAECDFLIEVFRKGGEKVPFGPRPLIEPIFGNEVRLWAFLRCADRVLLARVRYVCVL